MEVERVCIEVIIQRFRNGCWVYQCGVNLFTDVAVHILDIS